MITDYRLICLFATVLISIVGGFRVRPNAEQRQALHQTFKYLLNLNEEDAAESGSSSHFLTSKSKYAASVYMRKQYDRKPADDRLLIRAIAARIGVRNGKHSLLFDLETVEEQPEKIIQAEVHYKLGRFDTKNKRQVRCFLSVAGVSSRSTGTRYEIVGRRDVSDPDWMTFDITKAVVNLLRQNGTLLSAVFVRGSSAEGQRSLAVKKAFRLHSPFVSIWALKNDQDNRGGGGYPATLDTINNNDNDNNRDDTDEEDDEEDDETDLNADLDSDKSNDQRRNGQPQEWTLSTTGAPMAGKRRAVRQAVLPPPEVRTVDRDSDADNNKYYEYFRSDSEPQPSSTTPVSDVRAPTDNDDDQQQPWFQRGPSVLRRSGNGKTSRRHKKRRRNHYLPDPSPPFGDVARDKDDEPSGGSSHLPRSRRRDRSRKIDYRSMPDNNNNNNDQDADRVLTASNADDPTLVLLEGRQRLAACQLHDLTVDFHDIGWGGRIIAPNTFKANYCAGSCSFTPFPTVNATNHAVLLDIMQRLKLHPDIPKATCAPDRLSSLSLLYFDANENVVLTTFPKMSALSCACL